jgi:hypothetical protein
LFAVGDVPVVTLGKICIREYGVVWLSTSVLWRPTPAVEVARLASVIVNAAGAEKTGWIVLAIA